MINPSTQPWFRPGEHVRVRDTGAIRTIRQEGSVPFMGTEAEREYWLDDGTRSKASQLEKT